MYSSSFSERTLQMLQSEFLVLVAVAKSVNLSLAVRSQQG
jgi:hypothetical protein